MNRASSPVSQLTADKFPLPAIDPFGEQRIFSANSQINLILTEELLRIVPLVRKIVRRNLYRKYDRQAAEDVEHQVLLSLWQWLGRNFDGKLTTIEMEKIAARSAKRGAFSYYRKEMRNTTDPQVDFDNDNAERQDKRYANYNYRDIGENNNGGNTSAERIVSFTGNSEAEAASLGKFVFQTIEKLSLRQRFALLLQKNDLTVHLIATKACRAVEIAAALEVSKIEFLETLSRLPLSDEQIGELWQQKTGEKMTAKQVREARCKARRYIKQALE